MWNHAQNRSPSGDDDTNDSDPNSGLKDQLEKSLDLTHYLKYLRELFSQANSESDASASDDEGTSTFTDFLQPAAQPSSDRSHHSQINQNSLGPSTSSITDNNHVSSLPTTLKSVDGFHLEANISSSSLSSIDSGTSSLSLNLSSESYPETHPTKAEEAPSAKARSRENNGVPKSPNLCTESSNSSAPGTEDENSADKDKKSQKKKKATKKNENSPGQNKPSSGGKGNNGSKGGGAGGPSSGGGVSDDTTSGSGGSSSSSKSLSGSSGSGSPPGAKNRSAKQLKKNVQASGSQEVLTFATAAVDINSAKFSFDEEQLNSDALILNAELTSTDSSGIEFEATSFPMNALLDLSEDSNISDYISLTMTVDEAPHSSTESMSQYSTNFYNKAAVAAAAASSGFSKNTTKSRTNTNFAAASFGANKDNSKPEGSGKKRKFEESGKGAPSDKVAKLTEKQRQSRIQFLNARRKKIYVSISRKEVGKTQRNRANTFKESLVMKKKLAHACARHLRKKAVQSQKCMKDSVCKAKRLTQEMEIYWKHQERAERDLQRKKEKELEEKLKLEREISNQMVQARKLNNLASQLELFTARLLNMCGKEDELFGKVKSAQAPNTQSEENKKEEKFAPSQKGIDRALNDHQSLVKLLDTSGLYQPDKSYSTDLKNLSQPRIFQDNLKEYQVKGMSWLKHHYTLGLSGILADDPGLGKKAQVIAFLSHLAESYGIYGPYLVVAPTSSLNMWKQDFNKLVPEFKVVPYWGKPNARKALRQGWESGEKNGVYNGNASFHVVVTSYQVMVADLKFFSKVKWQYLITDDSQGAITSSTKWMSLLSFRCRSKLLVSSCLKLDSRSHLCAYLYFIMPSLFDAHEDFAEWLLKELESPNSIKYEPDESTLARLKSVCEQFLLRRLKGDVGNELVRHVDFQQNCCLSRRQQEIYFDLLGQQDLGGVMADLETCKPEEFIRNRMNDMLSLSVNLRKTCNHPDLIQEREIISPFWMKTDALRLPRIIYEDEPLFCEDRQLLNRLFNIFSALNVYTSLFKNDSSSKNVTNFESESSTWSFIRLLRLSCIETERLFSIGNLERLSYLVTFESVLEKILFDRTWKDNRNNLVIYPNNFLYHFLSQSQVLSKLVFTSLSPTAFSWETTIQHRTLRSRKTNSPVSQPLVLPTGLTELPKFLRCSYTKVSSLGFRPIVHGTMTNDTVQISEGRIAFSKLHRLISKHKVLRESSLLGFPELQSQIVTPDSTKFVSDSGKLKKLNGLLVDQMRLGSRVLICSYFQDTLDMLEKFLKIKRWTYVRQDLQDFERNSQREIAPFVYLMYTHDYVSNIPTRAVDTVVFFDHDWDTTAEEEITKCVNKLAHPNQVSCYRLVCKGSIEERIMNMAKERNIISLALSKDNLENPHGSLVPSLRGLVSVLLSEYAGNEELLKSQGSLKLSDDKLQESDRLKPEDAPCFNYDSKKTLRTYAKENHSGAVYEAIDDMIDYVSENRGSDSASPSCSEELDGAEMEADIDMKECQDDNFSFSFDEGYMGMSPDSYEDPGIKSDYEEDSSPKKPRLGRGSGKRGRPPSRIRFQMRDMSSDGSRRGPGRPRLKPVGPANQGLRGRRPGRPPLTKKAETISSGLAPLSSGQNIFGFYSSPDLELS